MCDQSIEEKDFLFLLITDVSIATIEWPVHWLCSLWHKRLDLWLAQLFFFGTASDHSIGGHGVPTTPVSQLTVRGYHPLAALPSGDLADFIVCRTPQACLSICLVMSHKVVSRGDRLIS